MKDWLTWPMLNDWDALCHHPAVDLTGCSESIHLSFREPPANWPKCRNRRPNPKRRMNRCALS